MPLTIIIPEAVIDDPVMVDLGQRFARRSRRGGNAEHPLGTIYYFSYRGENNFPPEAYAACHAYGCIMDGGELYVEVPASKLTEEVPSQFPDSVIPSDEEGVDGTVRTWGEYSVSAVELTNGNYRLRCLHFPPGKTTSQNGLLDSERKLWDAEFGQLLTKAEGLALETVEFDMVAP